MHETKSSQYIGYIETPKIINKVKGWVVSKNEYLLKSEDFTLVDVITGLEVGMIVNVYDKPDVFKFYASAAMSQFDKRKFYNCGFLMEFKPVPGRYVIKVKGEEVFEFALSSDIELDSIIKLNPKTKPELIVVDNFYLDPDKVREYALKQEFKSNEKHHKGSRTEKSYIPSWAGDEFKRLLNKDKIEFVGATGVFQYCIAKDNTVYHYDLQEYAAMVYLSPDAPLQTGTQTYRSIHTKLFGAATDEDEKRLGMPKHEIDAKSFNNNNFYDRNNMELVDSVANVYNRLVIFNARALHAATGYYGDTKENSRLFHLYFFNC